MSFDARSLYGGSPLAQPTGNPVMDHPPGTPEPTVRTLARPGGMSLSGNPTLMLVALLGVAVALIMRLHGHFD